MADRSTYMAEVLIHCLALAFGGWMVLPFFNTFDSAPSYALLERVAAFLGLYPPWDEVAWGCTICAVASWNLYLLRHLSNKRRQFGLYVAGLLTLVFGYEWAIMNPRSAFVPCFIVHALFCFWIGIRVRADYEQGAR